MRRTAEKISARGVFAALYPPFVSVGALAVVAAIIVQSPADAQTLPAGGIPEGAHIDAVSRVNGSLLLSFDVGVTLPGSGGTSITAKPSDLVLFDQTTSSFSVFFDGAAAGIPEGTNLDGAAYLSGSDHLLVSFDVNGRVGGVDFGPEDILDFDPATGAWAMSYDADQRHTGWQGADLKAAFASDSQPLGLLPGGGVTAVGFAPDVTVTLDGVVVHPNEIAIDDLAGGITVRSFPGVPESAHLTGFSEVAGGVDLLAFDTSVTLPGPAGDTTVTPRDVAAYNNVTNTYQVVFQGGSSTGVPLPTPVATLPPVANPTATPTALATSTPTAGPTGTPPPTATFTPVVTATATPTLAPTAAPTATPTPAITSTPTVGPTSTPTAGPTGTPPPTATFTAVPTSTPTPTRTPTPVPTPVCSGARASQPALSPPNGRFVPEEVVGVTSAAGPVTITINAIRQDEPLLNVDDTTCPDGAGIGTSTAQVRSERDQSGDGRVYHLAFTARNQSGGSCSGEVKVCVPHDQAHTSCGDGGATFDSTLCR